MQLDGRVVSRPIEALKKKSQRWILLGFIFAKGAPWTHRRPFEILAHYEDFLAGETYYITLNQNVLVNTACWLHSANMDNKLRLLCKGSQL